MKRLVRRFFLLNGRTHGVVKTNLLLIISFLAVGPLFAQPIPPIQWHKALGGSLAEYDNNRTPVLKVVKTSDKGYIMAGMSYSSDGDVSGNNGRHDAWIIKLNEKGALQWERNFGGNDWDWVNSIQQTSDSGFIVIGVVSSTNTPFNQRPGAFDVWIMKLSYQGDLQWQKFYGGSSWDYGQSILQTNDGGYIFCGRTESVNGDVNGNHGKSDIWVVRLNPAGNIVWQKCYGGVYTEFGNCINKTADGGYIIGGWQSQTGSDVVFDNDMQSYVVKIDANGNQQWEKKYGGSHYEDINSIKQTSDGGYIFTGTSCSNNGDVTGNHFGIFDAYHDAWVVKLDNAGNITWQKCIGGSNWDKGYDVSEASDGYYMIGQAQSNDGDVTGNHGLIDGMVAKLSLQGQLQTVKLIGGSSVEIFHSMLLEQNQANTEIVVAGHVSSFDGDAGGQHGNGDIWILKLSSQALQTNTLSGGAFLDNNANGLHDFGEPAYDNKYVYIKDNLGFYSKYKNTLPAFFSIPVDTGRFETDLNLADTSQYRSVPNKRISIFNTYGNNDFFEFALVRKDLLHTAAVYLSPDSIARPGRIVSYSGSYSYDGSRPQIDGLIKIVKDSRLTYTSSSLTSAFVSGDTIGLRFNNLVANNPQGFTINFQLANVPIAQPGDSLTLYYNMMPLTIDSAYFNDWDTLKQVIKPRVNFIKGEVFVDLDADNVWDNDEPFFLDGIVVSQKAGNSVVSNLNGFGFYNEVDTGAYITTLVPNRPYYAVNPAHHNSSFSTYYNSDSFGFAVVPMPGIRDLQIDVVPINPPKPGFNIMQSILFGNYGTQAIPNISVRYVKDFRTSLVDANPIPTSVQGDTLTWNFGALDPLEGNGIALQLKVATPPAANQGDSLKFRATVFPVAGDTTSLNNTFELKQVVVNSFDPNDKTESHAGKVSLGKLQSGDQLNYLIRFQNTGNAEATNISITDTLDTKLDWSSFEMTSASHSYRLNIVDGNMLTWRFDNIMLPDSNSNEQGSHGYIAYSIKARSNTFAGDTIKNTAFIYFDFNPAIATNTENTVVETFAALPIEIVSVTAFIRGKVIDVNWKTGFEYNVNHFEIERSKDGNHFISIGMLRARNLQNGSNYLFTDQQPLKGYNYFRIKSVDTDGTIRYSSVVLVRTGDANEVITYIFPNPSNGQIWFKMDGPVHGVVEVSLFDHAGKLLFMKNLGRQDTQQFSTPLSLRGLSKGNYLLKTTISGKVYLNRVVVQ